MILININRKMNISKLKMEMNQEEEGVADDLENLN